jgi:hypothetical protein
MIDIVDLITRNGFSLKRVSVASKEYAGPCPFCGGKDRFRVWPREGSNGGCYWCRGCRRSGDAIQFLRELKGLSFKEACDYLGVEKTSFRIHLPSSIKPAIKSDTWTPKNVTDPNETWQAQAQRLIAYAEKELEKNNGIKRWLTDRGINAQTIRESRLGWNPKSLSYQRSDWDLPEKQNPDGKEINLWIPVGLIIPYIRDNNIKRIRIRRTNSTNRYYTVSGSSAEMMILGNNRDHVVIVESELDALLIHQDAGDVVTTIALGSAQARPDTPSTNILTQAKLILIALDTGTEEKKEKAGYREWLWWKKHFKQSKRWPTVKGKDPGEAYRNGVSIRDWVMAGISE